MYYIGIDLGGTNIAVGLVDETGKIIHKDSTPTRRGRSYVEIIKDMAMLSLKVIKNARVDVKDVNSIGIGSPGTPNNKEGILIYSSNLNFRNVPMRVEMQKHIDLPVYIENDANCAALAESVAGAAKDYENSVTITLGTGIGSGIIIKDEVYSGFNYGASEFGHTIIAKEGEKCTCGREGCWERYASATALIKQTREAAKKNPNSTINKLVNEDFSKINAKIPFDAAKQGDKIGKQVVEQYIKYLSEGIINVINALQPEVLVIGGGISKEGESLLKPLRKLVRQGVFTREEVDQTQIKIAKMGNDAGIVGAAMLGKY